MNSLKLAARMLAWFAVPSLCTMLGYQVSRNALPFKLMAASAFVIFGCYSFLLWVRDRGPEGAALFLGLSATVVTVVFGTGIDWYIPATLPDPVCQGMVFYDTVAYVMLLVTHAPDWLELESPRVHAS